jgi:hypothetical protein
MGAGNAVNGFIEKSPIVQALMEKFLGGAGNTVSNVPELDKADAVGNDSSSS